MQSGHLGSQVDAASSRTQPVQLEAVSLCHWSQTMGSLKNIDHCLMEANDDEVRISHLAVESEAPPLEHIIASVVKSMHNLVVCHG